MADRVIGLTPAAFNEVAKLVQRGRVLPKIERRTRRVGGNSGDKLKLFVALEDFTQAGRNGETYATAKGYTRGICAELRFDNNLIDGSDEVYLRVDGWTTVVWNPINRESSGGDECGFTEIPCGQRFYAKFSGVSGHWEPVSGGVSNPGLVTCDCVNFGYSLWEIVDGAWSLYQNRCSGCYDPDATGRTIILPEERFEETVFNDDLLQPPDIDPADVPFPHDGKYFVKCCYPDGMGPPPPSCDCCYAVDVAASLTYVSGTNDPETADFDISESVALAAVSTSVPCRYDGSVVISAANYTNMLVSVTGSSLWLMFRLGSMNINVLYTAAGGDMDCDAGQTYTFDSATAWCLNAFCTTHNLTTATGTITNYRGDTNFDYEFPASLTPTVDPGCYYSGGGGPCSGTCHYVGVAGSSPTGFVWQESGSTCTGAGCTACFSVAQVTADGGYPWGTGAEANYPCPS